MHVLISHFTTHQVPKTPLVPWTPHRGAHDKTFVPQMPSRHSRCSFLNTRKRAERERRHTVVHELFTLETVYKSRVKTGIT